MIDQLDARRAQVYIESLIVEVTGDNAADFGFQWQGVIGGKRRQEHRRRRHQLRHRRQPAASSTSRAGVAGGDGAPHRSTLGAGPQHRPGAATSAAPTRWPRSRASCRRQANTNIVSTPNLVTLDNEEAKIIVGSNVPFVTGQFTSTGGAHDQPVPDHRAQGRRHHAAHQAADRRERHDPHDDLPGGVEPRRDRSRPAPSNAGPTTNKRSIESNVVVDDGQIIVLGGLIEDRYTDNKSKVPLLGDIPVPRRAVPQREPRPRSAPT